MVDVTPIAYRSEKESKAARADVDTAVTPATTWMDLRSWAARRRVGEAVKANLLITHTHRPSRDAIAARCEHVAPDRTSGGFFITIRA